MDQEQLNEFQKLMEEWLSTLDANHKDEYYVSERTVSEGVLFDFQAWLKARLSYVIEED